MTDKCNTDNETTHYNSGEVSLVPSIGTPTEKHTIEALLHDEDGLAIFRTFESTIRPNRYITVIVVCDALFWRSKSLLGAWT